jgi:hypothetical protein
MTATELTLVRQMRRGARNWIILCVILFVVFGAATWGLLANHPGTWGWIGIAVCGLLAGACAYSVIGRTLRKDLAQNPDVKELCERLKKPFAQLAEEFELEFAQSSSGDETGDIRFLPSWFYKWDMFSVDLVPYEDIGWVHKKVTKRSVNFVPLGTSVSLVIHVLRTGRTGLYLHTMDESASEAEVDALFARVAERAPWAILGWDPSLENNPTEVIARVRRKRAELERAAAAG